MSSSVNNKLIAKNTIYLYIRMLFVMAIGLYAVRVVLDQLGIVDYCIYNVIGGFVAMFAFMNRTLSTSSQRYFSIELAKAAPSDLNRLFCLNLTVFTILGVIVFILLETVGLWFVNNKMTIPEDRLLATNVLYQLSIVSVLFQILIIPYMALVIAHERMRVFALIGILEAIGKLGVVFLLNYIPFDKLIVYGALILFVIIASSLGYIIYSLKCFPESKFHWYWNKTEAMDLLGFSGWHFLGTFSTTCRSQGINILLNMFFNPAVNAARGIAYQVYNAVNQLVANFFTAAKPQIYKSYASNQLNDMFKLITRSSIICCFLISLVVFPVVCNTGLILGFWLKEVPEYTIVFVQLVLINGIVDSFDGPLSSAALSTGKIRSYELAISSVFLANIPISYIALCLGCNPEATMFISITLSCIGIVVRTFMLKRMLGFPMWSYLFLILKIALVSSILLLLARFCLYNKAHNILQFILCSVFFIAVQTCLYVPILGKEDRKAILIIIGKKNHKEQRK